MPFIVETLLALAVGLLIGAVIIGAVFLALPALRRRLGDVLVMEDDLGGQVEQSAGQNLEVDLAPVDLGDPDTRVVLGLRALDLYIAQGGDAKLLMLLPLSDGDAEALGSYATRRRRGY